MKKSKLKTPRVINISSILKKLPEELTTVTHLSKTLAMFLFVVLPFVGFLLGMRYEQWSRPTQSSDLLEFQYNKPSQKQGMCTLDAMECSDGSVVGRSGPDCEFICPATP